MLLHPALWDSQRSCNLHVSVQQKISSSWFHFDRSSPSNRSPLRGQRIPLKLPSNWAAELNTKYSTWKCRTEQSTTCKTTAGNGTCKYISLHTCAIAVRIYFVVLAITTGRAVIFLHCGLLIERGEEVFANSYTLFITVDVCKKSYTRSNSKGQLRREVCL